MKIKIILIIKNTLKIKEKNLLNVGRLENQKNQIFLLEAFKDCVKSDQQLHLIIVGNGNQYKELENLLRK